MFCRVSKLYYGNFKACSKQVKSVLKQMRTGNGLAIKTCFGHVMIEQVTGGQCIEIMCRCSYVTVS